MGGILSICSRRQGGRSTEAIGWTFRSNDSTDAESLLYDDYELVDGESLLLPFSPAPVAAPVATQDDAAPAIGREEDATFHPAVFRFMCQNHREPWWLDWKTNSASFRSSLRSPQKIIRRPEEKEVGCTGFYVPNISTPKSVNDNTCGGIIVGASRGCHDISMFVDRVQDSEINQDIFCPFTPLTEDEEDKVRHAMYDDGHSEEVLVTHSPSNIGITRCVMQCLSNGVWLNDEVINLYIELLKERGKRKPEKFLKCHFFNTFFYKKLISGKNGYDFNAVRRWTTQRNIGHNLTDCDKIFFPIHRKAHWCLAVIDVRYKNFQYLDSLGGGLDWTVVQVLARYFMDEMTDKGINQIDIASWTLGIIDGLPLQRNEWDCGMFMLKYMDFYSRGLPLCFTQDDMIYFRKRTALELLNLNAE